MRTTNVCVAPTVIRDLQYYGDGDHIIRELEERLGRNPLIGFECFDGFPGMRALNHLPNRSNGLPYIPTLGLHYVFLPAADLVASEERDEVLVFRVGQPIAYTRVTLSPEEAAMMLREIVEIYHLVRVVAP
jgi:hypothetical protein